MFGIGIVEVALLLLLIIGIVTLVARRVRRTPTGAPREVTREWRVVLAVRLLALVVGIGAGLLTYAGGGHGVGPMLSLAAFGGCILVGTALGETLVRPRPVPGVRSASLTLRRVRDYLPPTVRTVAGMVVATAGLLVFTTVTADGGPGLERGLGCTTDTVTQLHTPYPGSYYALPLAATLGALLGVATLAARQVVARPRGMAPDSSDDDLLRRNSLDVIVAATGCAVGAPLFSICLVAGGALNSLSSGSPTCAPDWYGPVGGLLMLLSLVPFVLTMAFLVRLALPARTRPQQRVPVA